MGHRHDWWESVRSWLIPKLSPLAQLLENATGREYYVTSETHTNQFVGRVPMNEESFEKRLHEMGFERNPLAAWKMLDSGESEEGSWRKVSFEESPNMQLHVVLYDGEKIQDAGDAGYTYVYAHFEYRWDRGPWKHYRGYRFDPDEGVKRMKQMLNEHGVSHEPIRP